MAVDAREIQLPTFNSNGEQTGVERLPVEQIGPNQFRLLHSPGFVEGLAAGDKLELSTETPLGYKVLERSGNLCVWFFFDKPEQTQGVEARKLCRAVETLGGYLDGGLDKMLIFTIPIAAGFSKVETVFSDAEERSPGATWMFGNVYDPSDGMTPLDWWEEQEQ